MLINLYFKSTEEEETKYNIQNNQSGWDQKYFKDKYIKYIKTVFK